MAEELEDCAACDNKGGDFGICGLCGTAGKVTPEVNAQYIKEKGYKPPLGVSSIRDIDKEMLRLQRKVEDLTIERDHFKSEVKLRNRCPVTNDEAAGNLRRAENAEYQCRELIGLIGEYLAMPCASLKTRMSDGAKRAELSIERIKNERRS